MTKTEILEHVLYARSRGRMSWRTLRGSDVATVSKDMRVITLRHVWSNDDDDDERVWDAVQRALAEYAREIADATGDLVEIYNKRGDLLDRVSSRHEAGTRGVTCTSRESFVAALPPPYAPQGQICVSEAVRRDLKLAAIAGLLPPDAKFWVRESSSSPVISVELAAWTGAVLADDYAAALMEALLAKHAKHAKHDTQWSPTSPKIPPQDARLALSVNDALALIKTIADRRIAEVMATRPMNYYGPMQYRLDISFPRLIAAAERGIRLEVDPKYAVFMHRARGAAARLGPRAVRSICGEGGLDLSSEQGLVELVQLDTAARGRPVSYSRLHGRWEVGGHA